MQSCCKKRAHVSDNTEFYLTATHYHPEHDLGATAFPPNAKMIRWIDQQKEADELGPQTNERFAGFSPVLAELLKDAKFRPADIIFEDEITLDLGGVHVRVLGVGPNHTRGDTVFFVEEDRVLYTGDVVMSVFPAANAQSGSIAKWIANMREFEALNPVAIVPAHGRLGDAAFRAPLPRVLERRAEPSRAGQAGRSDGGASDGDARGAARARVPGSRARERIADGADQRRHPSRVPRSSLIGRPRGARKEARVAIDSLQHNGQL